jgi:hypothetical protein
MTQIYAVDFQNKVLIESHCVPRRESWVCDCCKKKFVHIDGADNNTRRVELEKNIKTTSGKELTVTLKVCENCCNQLGDVFKENKQ